MKAVEKPQDIFTVELTRAEVEMIRGLTQNYTSGRPYEESEKERTTRLGLFVGAMRLLGYDIKADGTLLRVCS